MQTSLEIQNLKCGGCANTISTKLSNTKGLSNIEIDVDKNTITFDYDNEETLKEAKTLLAKIGYPEVGEKNPLGTKAKSYVSCAIGKMNKD